MISGLDSLGTTLTSLELGGNKIRVRQSKPGRGVNLSNSLIRKKIEGLDALLNLEELWLGKNKITKLEVWCPCTLDNVIFEPVRPLESWEFEALAIAINAVESSGAAREP